MSLYGSEKAERGTRMELGTFQSVPLWLYGKIGKNIERDARGPEEVRGDRKCP